MANVHVLIWETISTTFTSLVVYLPYLLFNINTATLSPRPLETRASWTSNMSFNQSDSMNAGSVNIWHGLSQPWRTKQLISKTSRQSTFQSSVHSDENLRSQSICIGMVYNNISGMSCGWTRNLLLFFFRAHFVSWVVVYSYRRTYGPTPRITSFYGWKCE